MTRALRSDSHIQWLAEQVVVQGVEYFPGWVDLDAYPALAPYCVHGQDVGLLKTSEARHA